MVWTWSVSIWRSEPSSRRRRLRAGLGSEALIVRNDEFVFLTAAPEGPVELRIQLLASLLSQFELLHLPGLTVDPVLYAEKPRRPFSYTQTGRSVVSESARVLEAPPMDVMTITGV